MNNIHKIIIKMCSLQNMIRLQDVKNTIMGLLEGIFCLFTLAADNSLSASSVCAKHLLVQSHY